MKLIKTETLLDIGGLSRSTDGKRIMGDIERGVAAVCWPKNTSKFQINPKSKGNGVKPIKNAMMSSLQQDGWKLETQLDLTTSSRPGKLDAVLEVDKGFFAFEWETGNISSSHRALNKMAVGILKGKIIGGVLAVPSRSLYKYLTDRVGNFAELEPYLLLWKSLKPDSGGWLSIVVFEHDEEDSTVILIPKGIDGRARR